MTKELLEIKKQLEKVYDDDQNLRIKWEQIINEYGYDSKELKEHLKLVNETQKINLEVVENILSKYGWLSPKAIGEKASYALFLVIQHSNNNTMKKYSSTIQEAFKSGYLDNNSYAMFKDRLLLEEGKNQLYGTQYILDESTKEFVLESITSIEEINKNRKEIGLPPIK